MKKKIIVLGASGLIGHQIYSRLKLISEYKIIGFSNTINPSQEFVSTDVSNFVEFSKVVKRLKPDCIINCIGILIEASNASTEKAIYLNALFPHLLSNLCEEINAKLIHMSTDCVFSGDKEGPYKEEDLKDGMSIYAKTKALGEIITDKHLTIRTSVIGPEIKENGTELFHWFVSQKEKINGYNNVFWSGVTSLELARALEIFISSNITGLYHVTNNNTISKYELLKLFKKYTNSDIDIEIYPNFHNDKTFKDSRLELNYQFPSYDQMVRDMVDDIRINKNRYPHYKLII